MPKSDEGASVNPLYKMQPGDDVFEVFRQRLLGAKESGVLQIVSAHGEHSRRWLEGKGFQGDTDTDAGEIFYASVILRLPYLEACVTSRETHLKPGSQAYLVRIPYEIFTAFLEQMFPEFLNPKLEYKSSRYVRLEHSEIKENGDLEDGRICLTLHGPVGIDTGCIYRHMFKSQASYMPSVVREGENYLTGTLSITIPLSVRQIERYTNFKKN